MASESSASLPIIAVCGATGNQGGSVVKALLTSKKFRVRALTRKPEGEKAKSLRDMGCEVMKIDFDHSIEEMKSCFVGCHGAFLVTNFTEHLNVEKDIAQGIALAKVTKETAGMKHVILSTVEDTPAFKEFSAKYNVEFFNAKGKVNEFMKSINLPVIFLCVSFYWENMIAFRPQKQEDGTYNLVLLLDNVPLPGLALVDIGRSVAALFEKGLGEPGEYFGLASEHLLISEMANILSEVSGKQVNPVSIDPQVFRDKGDTMSVLTANIFQFKSDHNKEYCEVRNMDKVRALIKPTSFKDFCKENIALLFKD